MKFFSEDEVRKLIEETDIHDGIRGTADDYLPAMKGIELPDNHGRLIDADAFKAYLLEWLMKFVTHPNFLEAKKMTEDFFRDIDEAPTVLEASNG